MMRLVDFNIEPFSDELAAELLPLGQKCWEESTAKKGQNCAFYGEREFQIEPDFDQYRNLAAQNALVIVVMRENRLPKGYVLGWCYRALHHRSIIGAIGDTLYVEPEFRAYAGNLVDMFLKELTDRRVQIIGWPATLGSYVHQFLTARGFVGDDIVMEKRLCV